MKLVSRLLGSRLLALPLLLTSCLSFHRGAIPGEPTDATYAQIEGARIRYLDVGEGPAVVLIHGFASRIENWKLVIPELEKGHRVLALDLKGFGWSDRPRGDYSPQAQAAIVYALMQERGIEQADIVAHSWGSSVALALSIQHPEAVRKVALYDAWVFDEQLSSFFHLSRARGLGEFLFAAFYNQRPDDRIGLGFYAPENIPEAFVEDVESILARPGTRAAALEAVRGMHLDELSVSYSKIQAPVMLLWGREDRVTPASYGERLQRMLPTSQMQVYARCGHFPMLEAAPESTHDLKRFLEATP